MGYVIPAGYCRVTLHYGAESSLGSAIITGIGIDSSPTEGVLDIFQEWWEESLKLVTASTYELQRIEARNDVEVIDRSIGETGLMPEDVLPPNTAVLVNLGSGLVGRRNRGRMYLPGVAEENAVSDQGVLSSGKLTQLQGVMDYFGALLVDNNRTARILHSTVGTPTLVLNASVNPVVATQRRRLRR